jgi:predicted dehydrogenase
MCDRGPFLTSVTSFTRLVSFYQTANPFERLEERDDTDGDGRGFSRRSSARSAAASTPPGPIGSFPHEQTEPDSRERSSALNNDRPVRIGLMGYGFGGRFFHAPLIASSSRCDFVGVVTTSSERKDLVSREHPGTPTFTSLAALREAGAEAVTISTPAHTHSSLTDEALRLGLAVVCDKPFAMEATSAKATVQLADELGLVLSPYQNRRWDSDFLTVRKLAADGSLGEITRFESRFERFAPQEGPPTAGGGTLLDFCSHLVDQSLVLLGPAASVYAELRTRESGLDDDVFLAITHESGARSHLWGSWRQAAPGPRFRVTGTEGAFVLTAGDTQEDVLVAGDTPASRAADWGVEPEPNWGVLSRGADRVRVPSASGQWQTYYPAFADAVQGLGPVPVNPQDAVATATVLDAAALSARSGAVVNIEPV